MLLFQIIDKHGSRTFSNLLNLFMVELVARSTMAPFSLPCPVKCGWSTVYTLGGAGGCQGVAGGPYLAGPPDFKEDTSH